MANYTLVQDGDNGDVIFGACVSPDDQTFIEGGKIFKICNDGVLWRYPNVNPDLGLTLEDNENGQGYVAFTK